MAIHVDVLAGLDERAADAVASGLERRMAEAGASSGTAFGRHFGEAMATIVGGLGAAAIGLGRIGSQFEDINRDITLNTTATGAALDDMRAKVDALAGSLDTSMSGFGNVMGVLAGRLQAPIDQVSTLGVHVQELSGRFKGLDVDNLSAAFVQFGVGAGQADNVLASLLQTSQQYQVALPNLTNNLAQFGVTLTSAGLNMQQSGHLMGEMQRAAIPLQQGLLGLETAAKTWNTATGGAASGRSYQQFLLDAATAMRQLSAEGKQAEADQMAVTIAGQRRWQQFAQAAQIYLDTVRAGGGAFEAYPGYIDQALKATQTLHNHWEQLRNQIAVTLEPVATPFIDRLIEQLKGISDWALAHREELKSFFQQAADVAGSALSVIVHIAEWLGRYPGLIRAAADAFIAWKTISGAIALQAALEKITLTMHAMPAEAAASGAAAGTGFMGAFAAALTPIGIAAAMALIGSEAAHAFDDHFHTKMAEQAAIPGSFMWVMNMLLHPENMPQFGGGGQPSATGGLPPQLGGPGPAPAPGQVAGPGHAGLLPGQVVPAPAVPSGPALQHHELQGWAAPAPGGIGAGIGSPVVGVNPDGTPLTLDDLQNPKKPGKGSGPQVPYPAEYGQPPAPGETPEHWRNRMAVIEAQHDLATKRAALDQLEKDHNASQDQIQKARNDVLQAQVRVDENQQRGTGRQQGAQVPFGPGYGAAPRPGEREQVYSAEQGQLEAQHRTATARAQLAQVERDSTATAEDLVKARNDVLTAEREEYQSQLRLNEALTRGNKGLDDFGMKLDSDFGLSKGLPGLAENLVKFLGNLAFAPAFGALAGTEAAAGGVPKGAGGLIGMAAVSGAFGPQFTGAGTGSGTPGSPGAGIPSVSLPGTPSTPAEFAAAGGSIASLYAFANSMVGTPYSQQLRNDCSGMVSRLVNVALGASPDVSFDTTGEGAYLAAHGFTPGIAPPGSPALQVGWNPQPGNAGHTAATLPGGVHAESGGSVGAFALGGPVGGESDQFSQHAFLMMSGAGGLGGLGGGRGFGGSGTVPVFVVNMPGGGFAIPTPGGDAGGGGGGGGGGGLPGPGAPASSGYNFDALAKAEAGGNWANTSNPKYSGGLQFDHDTWMAYKPPGAPDVPASATKEQQIQAAQNAIRARGGPQTLWPQNWRELLKPSGALGGKGPNSQANIPQTAAEQAIREGNVPSHPGVSMPPGFGSGGPVPMMDNGGPVGAPGDMARIPMRDQMPWGFSTGSSPYFGGPGQPVPIVAHGGEWVIRKDAVDHYGAGMMAAINARSFDEGGQIGPFPVPPQVAAAAQPAPGYAQIGTGMSPVTVTPTGGIQPPEAPRPNAPAPPMVGTNPDTSVTAPGTPHAGTGAAPGAAGPTQISGVSPPQGYGQGIHSTGGGIIGAAAEAGNIMPGAGAAAQIASQEAQRLIQYGGQVAGALTQGFLDTVLPTGGSKLAQNNWITRIAGGIVGARPQIPQLAGIDSQTGQPRPTPTAEGLLGPTTPHQGAGAQPGAGTTHHGPIIQINGDLNAPNADRAGNDINRHLQQTYAGNTGAGR